MDEAICPRCGGAAQSGWVSGWFQFHRYLLDWDDPDGLNGPDWEELRRLWERHLVASTRRYASDGRFPLYLEDSCARPALAEARAEHCLRCLRCGWMDIAGATLTLKRRTRRGGGLVTNLPLRSWDEKMACCPECSATLQSGFAFATIWFRRCDEPEPGFWRRQVLWWLRGIGAKARARSCPACDWMGLDPATLVEPSPPCLSDRIQSSTRG